MEINMNNLVGNEYMYHDGSIRVRIDDITEKYGEKWVEGVFTYVSAQRRRTCPIPTFKGGRYTTWAGGFADMVKNGDYKQLNK